jgi:hypothetical protein
MDCSDVYTLYIQMIDSEFTIKLIDLIKSYFQPELEFSYGLTCLNLTMTVVLIGLALNCVFLCP